MITPEVVTVHTSHVDLVVNCRGGCGKAHKLRVPRSEYTAYFVDRKHAQDALPSLDAAERELLISGTCGKCWNEMFPPEPGEEYQTF